MKTITRNRRWILLLPVICVALSSSSRADVRGAPRVAENLGIKSNSSQERGDREKPRPAKPEKTTLLKAGTPASKDKPSRADAKRADEAKIKAAEQRAKENANKQAAHDLAVESMLTSPDKMKAKVSTEAVKAGLEQLGMPKGKVVEDAEKKGRAQELSRAIRELDTEERGNEPTPKPNAKEVTPPSF